MNIKQYEMDMAIKALRAAANGLSAAIDNETITGDQVHSLFKKIAHPRPPEITPPHPRGFHFFYQNEIANETKLQG